MFYIYILVRVSSGYRRTSPDLADGGWLHDLPWGVVCLLLRKWGSIWNGMRKLTICGCWWPINRFVLFRTRWIIFSLLLRCCILLSTIFLSHYLGNCGLEFNNWFVADFYTGVMSDACGTIFWEDITGIFSLLPSFSLMFEFNIREKFYHYQSHHTQTIPVFALLWS